MVTVKRIGGGLFSNWIGDRLKAGDTIDVMPPHGSFTTSSIGRGRGTWWASPAGLGSLRSCR